MKKVILFGKDSYSLELSALFLFVLILVSNLAVIKFAEGYFGYFDIGLGLVNFTPQMYDYERVSMPVLVVSGIFTIVVVYVMWLSSRIGQFFGSKVNSKKLAKHIELHEKFFVKLADVLEWILKIVIVGAIVWFSWSFITGIAMSIGRLSAQNMKELNSISVPGDSVQEVIIYRGNGELIVKPYDTSEGTFLDGYRVVSGDGYLVRTISR